MLEPRTHQEHWFPGVNDTSEKYCWWENEIVEDYISTTASEGESDQNKDNKNNQKGT